MGAFLFVFAVSLKAEDQDFKLSCPENIDAKKVGQMLLDSDFSGFRALGMEGHECLDQENFPHVRVHHDPPQEASEEFSFYILDSEEYKVTKVEVVDEEIGLHRIHFEVKAYPHNQSSNAAQTYEDKMSYVFYPSERMRATNGCGGMITTPERIYLKKSCLPEL